MLRSIVWLLAAVVILILSLPVALCIRLFGKKEPYGPAPAAAAWFCRKIVPFVARLGGVDLELTGTENLPEGPALFTGNHQGDFDVLLILFCLGGPHVIVAKKEAKKVPIARLWMKLLGCIFMDRKDVRQSLECIKQAQDQLEHGISVVIFPEGTRSKGPDMNEFKPGAYKCAIKAGVPVVPFALDGTYKCFEERRLLTKSKVRFSILPPVDPAAMGITKTQELADLVQKRIAEELQNLRATNE